MDNKQARALTLLRSLPLVEAVDFLEPLQAGIATVIDVDEQNLLMRMDDMLFCMAHTPEDLMRMQARFEPMMILNLHAPFDAKELLQPFHFETAVRDYNVLYPKQEPIDITLPSHLTLAWLQADDVPFVHAHYKTVDDIEYITDRVTAGMLGAYVDGQLAGFIGTHDEMTMGLLHVLPAYRRMQLGYILEASLINHLLQQGRLPYAQVAITNDASLALQKKLGLLCSSQPLQLFFDRKKG